MTPAASSRAANGAPNRPAAPRRAPARARFAILDQRALQDQRQQRRARVLLAIAGLCLAFAFGAVAIGQSMVASNQLRIDLARQGLVAAIAQQQQLQLERAQLESPERILAIARSKLHMVQPAQVTYLAPVNPGPSLAAMRAPSAGPRAPGRPPATRARRK